MNRPHAVFLINLLQDVNILRPLVIMAARDFHMPTRILITTAFQKRDNSKSWMHELSVLSAMTGASLNVFADEFEGLRLLQGYGGILISAAESNLSAHRQTHTLIQAAPASYLKVTLQHGFECVGFRQSREHDRAHGQEVTFAADIVCGWYDRVKMTAMAPSQMSKLVVTGPTAVLQRPELGRKLNRGLICENLHSVRLHLEQDSRGDFIDIFTDFCADFAKTDQSVSLRPHPGGQYVVKNKVALPPNALMNNHPIYKVDLSAYSYGISAPSSILIDMVLAGIPVAVWSGLEGKIDVSAYSGLTEISTLNDWIDFAREAQAHPERFIEQQQAFLARQGMPIEPEDVYRRYASIFEQVLKRVSHDQPVANQDGHARPRIEPGSQEADAPPLRVLVASEGILATQSISFGCLRSKSLEVQFWDGLHAKEALSTDAALDGILPEPAPDVLILSRYTDASGKRLIAWAREQGAAIVYHLDDDLFSVPTSLGAIKFAHYNDPVRRQTLQNMVNQADLVYASTQFLAGQLQNYGLEVPVFAGDIYCTIDPTDIGTRRAADAPVIGYMGSSGHGSDLNLVVPAIIALLEERPELSFELFGTIAMPAALDRFASRVYHHPSVWDYAGFLKAMKSLGWWIGLAPLENNSFNCCKADTKWVEYSLAGIPVIASDLIVYQKACAGGAGILVGERDDWLVAMREVLDNPGRRNSMVQSAQEKLAQNYTREALSAQVQAVVQQALALRAHKPSKQGEV